MKQSFTTQKTKGFAIAFLVFIGTVSGKDVYQPVKRGNIELAAGASYTAFPGLYNASGDFQSWRDLGFPKGYLPAVYAIPFQVKYGLGAGFDLKASSSAIFTNEDAGSSQGMTQPVVGIKYAWSRGGLFSNLTLPVAAGDVDNGHLVTALETGGLVRGHVTHFRFTGLASYTRVSHGNDALRLSVQPEILWSANRSSYLDIEYLKSVGKNIDLVLVNPGLRADITKSISCDAYVPLTVAGHNAPVAWQFRANLYWALKT